MLERFSDLKTYVDVLDNVDLANILAQAANTDTVTTIADKVLHNNVGTVGLE